MKKIFSFMLIAVGLLISGNAKAGNCVVKVGDVVQTELTDLKTALNTIAANAGGVYTDKVIYIQVTADADITPNDFSMNIIRNADDLDDDGVDESDKLSLPTDKFYLFKDNQQITIDLGENNTIYGKFFAFQMNHGKLKFTGKGTVETTYSMDDAISAFSEYNGTLHSNQCIFRLYGSDKSTDQNYSQFIIDENVSVLAPISYACGIYPKNNSGDASYGSVFTVNGYLSSRQGIAVNGSIKAKGDGENHTYIPEFIVGPNGTVISEAPGIYAAGYCRWTVQGHVVGSCGMYVKSGIISIEDNAKIEGIADTYEEPQPDGSGTTGGDGCGIVFDTNTGYAQGMEITIKDNATIIASNGNALYEVKTDADESGVSMLKIEGGNFQVLNDDYACLKTTDEVRDMVRNNGTITGGVYNTDEVKNYVGKDQVITFYSNVDGEDKWTIGSIPSDQTWQDNFNTPNSYVQLNNKTAQLAVTHVTTDQTIKYLAVLGNDQVVIDDNVTLTVGAVVVNDGSSIVVSPKAALRVNEKGGLISTDAENLIIEASEEGSGTFIFNTDVKSNRNPYATVQYFARYAHAYSGGHENYMFDIMVSPFRHIDELTYSFGSAESEPEEGGDWSAYQLWQNGHWVKISSYQQLYDNARAFQPIAITNSSKIIADEQGKITSNVVVYNFKGMLEGNNDGSLDMGAGYNYMGNAYLAPMDASALLDQVIEKDKLDNNFWYWNGGNQSFQTMTKEQLGGFEMSPMSFFVLHSTAKENVQFDYKKLIWDFNTNK